MTPSVKLTGDSYLQKSPTQVTFEKKLVQVPHDTLYSQSTKVKGSFTGAKVKNPLYTAI